jgi:hypothetical protein
MNYTPQQLLIWLGKKEISSKYLETGKIAGLLYQIKNAVGWRGRKNIFFFFFFLFYKSRKKNVTNKTIPKLVNESGNVITDQNQILQETRLIMKTFIQKEIL